MTTSLMSILPGGVYRKVLWWRDDDEATSTDVTSPSDTPSVPNFNYYESELAETADGYYEPSNLVTDIVGSITSLATSAIVRDDIRKYSAALKGIDAFDFVGTTGFATFVAEIKSTGVTRVGVGNLSAKPVADLVPMVDDPSIAVQIGRFRDVYSSAMMDLTQIGLVLESINNSVNEVLRSFIRGYVGDRGAVHFGDDSDGPDWSDLTYTDRLGDLPPLPRTYDDVEVVIVDEEEMKPRRYSDEDFQAWGT